MEFAIDPKIIIFAVYFGKLPEYFPLWLKSCGYNPTIEFRLITNADVSGYSFPQNVSHRHKSIEEVADKISTAAKTDIYITNAYKLCDLKPLYWALIEQNETCDFWGHCDLDMIFGDLSTFITPDILEKYDKIFSVGHLTIYRNTVETNNFYRKPHPDLDFQSILSDYSHRGFDEHIGVNRIWIRHGGRFYANENLIADIDPHIKRFERTSNYIQCHNYRHQVFLFDNGHVRRLYWAGGSLKLEEFLYIHFQKRKFCETELPEGCERFYITPRGFLPASDQLPDKSELDRLNGRPLLNSSEVRQRIRRLKRRIFRSSQQEETVA